MTRPECRQCQEWMEDAFGGGLAAEHRSTLDAHLAGCEECRLVREDYRLLRRGLDFLAENDGPSPFVEAKILRAAKARHAEPAARPSAFWRWLLRPATVGFATLALIAGLGYLGREELLRHRRPDDLTAPLPPPATSPAEPTFGGAADSVAPAVQPPLAQDTPEVPQKTKSPPPTAQPAKPRQEAKPALKPAPAPAEEKARLQTAPFSAPAASDGAAPEPKGRTRESRIPEAEFAPPPQAKPDAEAKQALESEGAEPAPAKSLQRGAPPSGATRADPSSAEIGAEPRQKETREDERFRALLESAKAKLRRQEYAKALEDLLAAQKIHDKQEVQDLIRLCQSHLRGDD